MRIAFWVLEVTATTESLNQQAPPNARTKTYESPLFLDLKRPYPYPPDALHLDLNNRAAQLPAAVACDALTSAPDYLVVGSTARTWKLYQALIEQGAFRPLEKFGQYEIYQRVRE